MFFLMFSSGLSNNNSDETFKKEKLIFIYNASDDLISVSFDFVHKIVSPSTYKCNLCKITYGNVSMHNKWKEYIYNSSYDFEFLYKNNYLEYHKDLKIENFPVAYKYNGNSYDVFISKKEFDSCNDLEALIQIVNQKLNKD